VIRVLIADDQSLVRAGLRSLLDDEADLEVVGEAGDGAQAVRLAARVDPDVVLMDIRMPVQDGIAATRALAEARSRARVLMLTTYNLDEYVFSALRAGAVGFLLKDASAEDLANGVRVVAAGEALLAPAVTTRLITEFARTASADTGKAAQVARLTERERAVLVQLARGGTNAEVGAALYISPATVKSHVANILAKLELRDRVPGGHLRLRERARPTLERVRDLVLTLVAVGRVADEADLVVLRQHQLAVAGIGLVVEQVQHVVVVLHPPALAAAHVLNREVVLVVARAVVLLVGDGRVLAGRIAPVVENVRVLLFAGVRPPRKQCRLKCLASATPFCPTFSDGPPCSRITSVLPSTMAQMPAS
jgi:DNA-binding NarL/FixJ family response regulator